MAKVKNRLAVNDTQDETDVDVVIKTLKALYLLVLLFDGRICCQISAEANVSNFKIIII